MRILRLFLSAAFALARPAFSAESPKPNIVYVLCDDLGYGDVKCLNAEAKIATPHCDRLAAGGMVFTDAHSSSAVCTPTRYGILTGRYAWRSRLKSGVLGGMSPPLIEAGRLTVPAFLRQHDLAADIGETQNVQAEHPEIVGRLRALLEKYADDGRSTPGAPQPNTTPIRLLRSAAPL